MKVLRRFSIALATIFVVGCLGYKNRNFLRYEIYYPLKDTIASDPYYEKVSCPKNSLVIVTLGQSNSANYVKPKSDLSYPQNLLQYDWRSGRCFKFKEPLLGATGFGGREGGNVISYTAERVSRLTSNTVTVVSLGVGGSYVRSWSEGHIEPKFQIALKRLKKDGLDPTIFFWHQGESDSPQSLSTYKGTDRSSYYNHLSRIIDKTRSVFPKSLFGVALATICSDTKEFEPVRQAQKDAVKTLENVFLLADSDKIHGERSRYDGCHFTSQGARELGEIYYNTLKGILSLPSKASPKVI